MATNLDRLYDEAMRLSDESKAALAERLVEYLATNINPEIELTHIGTVKRRKGEIREKKVSPIDGPAALNRARIIVSK